MSKLLHDILPGQVWKMKGNGKMAEVIALALNDLSLWDMVVWKGDSGQHWVTPLHDFRARKMDLISSPPSLELKRVKVKAAGEKPAKKKGKK